MHTTVFFKLYVIWMLRKAMFGRVFQNKPTSWQEDILFKNGIWYSLYPFHVIWGIGEDNVKTELDFFDIMDGIGFYCPDIFNSKSLNGLFDKFGMNEIFFHHFHHDCSPGGKFETNATGS